MLARMGGGCAERGTTGRVRLWVAAIIVAGLCVSTGNAVARRNATPPETEAIAGALTVAPDCVAADISTVDPSWAAAYVAGTDCPEGNGVIVLHLHNGAWMTAYTGPADDVPCPLDRAVPDNVAKDLGLCFTPSSKVYLPYFEVFKYKPSKLPQGAHAVIEKLKWRNWGRPTATATGTFDYVDAYERFKAPVKLKAYGRNLCGHRRSYLRLSISASRAADRKKLSFATGVQRLTCPGENG